MIPTNNLKNFAQNKVVRTVRQSDRAELIATREVIDINLPIRWDVTEKIPETSPFKKPVSEVKTPLSTSQLVRKGQVEGYGNWYPPIEKMVEIFPIDAEVDDQSKKQLTPKYVEPDTTEYLVD